MTTGTLKTKEPITIDYEEFSFGDTYLIFTVDDYEYCTIDAEIDDLDLDKVRVWIEETYYESEYRFEDHYFVPRLQSTNFLKGETTNLKKIKADFDTEVQEHINTGCIVDFEFLNDLAKAYQDQHTDTCGVYEFLLGETK